MAAEGADIVGIDLCAQLNTVSYPMATLNDLEETVSLVENHGRRMVARRSDVRDLGTIPRAQSRHMAGRDSMTQIPPEALTEGDIR